MSYNFESTTALQTAALIRTGKADPCEILDYHLERIGKLNPALNALRFVNRDNALREMRVLQGEIKAGKLRGRLHGLAFSLKDSFSMASLPRSDGSKGSLADNLSYSSALVQKILDEGAVCIGKANMAEYGKSYYTTNPLFGRTNSPFDPERTPGGSGGGDSAAVACGFAQFGIGADAGGSIRVPANFCGLFGLFPTRGIFSDACPNTFTHTFINLFRNPGPLTRSLDDLELLYHILRTFDRNDAYSACTPPPDYRKPHGRIAFFSEINGVKCDAQIQASLQKTVRQFTDAGFTAEEHTPDACRAAYEIFIVLAGQAALILEDMLADIAGNPRNPADEGEIMKNLRHRIATELPPLTVETLLRCWHLVDEQRHRITETFAKYDFILAPVSASLPPKHGTSVYEVDSQKLQSQQVFQFASMVNVLALPSVAFPTGTSAEGLPLGLQLIGPRFSEKHIIQALRAAGFTGRHTLPAGI